MAEHRPCTARNETPLHRADRNFVQLLQELRVTQTGVQILFAFLLSLAFTSRFGDLVGAAPRLVRRAGRRPETDGTSETTEEERAGDDVWFPAPLRRTVRPPSGLRGTAAHREARRGTGEGRRVPRRVVRHGE